MLIPASAAELWAWVSFDSSGRMPICGFAVVVLLLLEGEKVSQTVKDQRKVAEVVRIVVRRRECMLLCWWWVKFLDARYIRICSRVEKTCHFQIKRRRHNPSLPSQSTSEEVWWHVFCLWKTDEDGSSKCEVKLRDDCRGDVSFPLLPLCFSMDQFETTNFSKEKRRPWRVAAQSYHADRQALNQPGRHPQGFLLLHCYVICVKSLSRPRAFSVPVIAFSAKVSEQHMTCVALILFRLIQWRNWFMPRHWWFNNQNEWIAYRYVRPYRVSDCWNRMNQNHHLRPLLTHSVIELSNSLLTLVLSCSLLCLVIFRMHLFTLRTVFAMSNMLQDVEWDGFYRARCRGCLECYSRHSKDVASSPLLKAIKVE